MSVVKHVLLIRPSSGNDYAGALVKFTSYVQGFERPRVVHYMDWDNGRLTLVTGLNVDEFVSVMDKPIKPEAADAALDQTFRADEILYRMVDGQFERQGDD